MPAAASALLPDQCALWQRLLDCACWPAWWSLQAGEVQHAAAVQACLATLQHHRYADPNPRDVDDAFDRQAPHPGWLVSWSAGRLQAAQMHK